ncbi:hypothetical protein [Mariniblastus fucicola]|uniref:Uncharacterized protein n=1 Tax=Mariniblastus fucicola TaxID=980251 RepID=A0A5B9PDA5_9BACT|nr:hypothetical protein [Mariniblastus fucicola]QEG23439.1 hypothetical protein MFFC18_33380 [Mariniblastus fucicola]
MNHERKRRTRNPKLNYGTLEDRRLLAASARFKNGLLKIQMDASGDSVKHDVGSDSQVLVNGSTVEHGASALEIDSVRHIQVFGTIRTATTISNASNS